LSHYSLNLFNLFYEPSLMFFHRFQFLFNNSSSNSLFYFHFFRIDLVIKKIHLAHHLIDLNQFWSFDFCLSHWEANKNEIEDYQLNIHKSLLLLPLLLLILSICFLCFIPIIFIYFGCSDLLCLFQKHFLCLSFSFQLILLLHL
jgi:hypothetical protein